jgi:hypothetical protein
MELREPVPGTPGLAPRLVLIPSSSIGYPELAAWLGPGEPHHVDGLPPRSALATVRYTTHNTIFATFVLQDLAVRALTIGPPEAAPFP